MYYIIRSFGTYSITEEKSSDTIAKFRSHKKALQYLAMLDRIYTLEIEMDYIPSSAAKKELVSLQAQINNLK